MKENPKLYSWLKDIPDDFEKGFLLLSKYKNNDDWMMIGCYGDKEETINAMREEASELDDIEYLVYEVNETLRVSELNSNNNKRNPIPLFFGIEHTPYEDRINCVREWKF